MPRTRTQLTAFHVDIQQQFLFCVRYTMNITMPSSAILVLSGLATTYVFLRFLLAFTHDSTEPPALATTIPFLGPLIGMRRKHRFYIDLR